MPAFVMQNAKHLFELLLYEKCFQILDIFCHDLLASCEKRSAFATCRYSLESLSKRPGEVAGTVIDTQQAKEKPVSVEVPVEGSPGNELQVAVSLPLFTQSLCLPTIFMLKSFLRRR